MKRRTRPRQKLPLTPIASLLGYLPAFRGFDSLSDADAWLLLMQWDSYNRELCYLPFEQVEYISALHDFFSRRSLVESFDGESVELLKDGNAIAGGLFVSPLLTPFPVGPIDRPAHGI